MWDKFIDFIGIKFYPQAELVAGPGDIILNVPAYRQLQTYTCGAVAAKMVADYFGKKTSLNDIVKFCKTDDDGTSTNALKKFLRKKRVSVHTVNCPKFEYMCKRIEGGSPIIVANRYDTHWIVVVGCNRKLRRLYISGEDYRKITWSEFRKQGAREQVYVCSK